MKPMVRRAFNGALYAEVFGNLVVFSGGLFGRHTLALDVSPEARILAHWDGYCQANGLSLVPSVGQKVRFASSSNWQNGGTRRGTVIKVGPKRTTVQFRYKNGRITTVSLPHSEVTFGEIHKS